MMYTLYVIVTGPVKDTTHIQIMVRMFEMFFIYRNKEHAVASYSEMT